VSTGQIGSLLQQLLVLTAMIAAPPLLAGLVVGVLVGILQSVTQIQEVTLTFVPKFVAVGLVMLLAGSWMLTELINFTQGMFRLVPELISN
jgi:flagellar biosynthetic protein FliQ